jgi:undecaprenyl-diphosphatase
VFAGSTGLLVYLGIALAAAIEGEVAYVAAATLVAHGQLNPLWVVIAGATGAAAGDQAFFYLFRGRLARWTARYPSLERTAAPLVAMVRRRATLMVLLIRFAPGLRVAIAAACAYVEMPPLKFSILNGLTALVWAILLLVVVAWAGPATLARFGLGGWKGALVAGIGIVVLFRVLGRYERRVVGSQPPL